MTVNVPLYGEIREQIFIGIQYTHSCICTYYSVYISLSLHSNLHNLALLTWRGDEGPGKGLVKPVAAEHRIRKVRNVVPYASSSLPSSSHKFGLSKSVG